MIKKEIKDELQLKEEFDNAVKCFHDTYPDIYKFSSDRQVSCCLLLMLKKYDKIFSDSKVDKKEDIINSVNILTKFVAKYKPQIAYSDFCDRDYVKQRKIIFKKGKKLLKNEMEEFKKQMEANKLDNIMSK